MGVPKSSQRLFRVTSPTSQPIEFDAGRCLLKGGATGCDAYDEYIQLDAPYKIGPPPNAESETHNPQHATRRRLHNGRCRAGGRRGVKARTEYKKTTNNAFSWHTTR